MFNKASNAFMTLGFELVGLIVVAVFLGRWADSSFGWTPWGLVGGITAVFIGWVYHVYIIAQMLAKQDESGDNSRQ